ncbi:MAG: sulfate adenylyltransferase [Acidobacteriota bacterium]
MIKPHGSDELHPLYVQDRASRTELLKEAKTLPSITVSSATAANAVMLGCGYFNPLAGFMDKQDALSIADTMKTASGLFWPIPVLNLVPENSISGDWKNIALRDPNVDGNPILAVQEIKSIETFSEAELRHVTEKVFGTTDASHPGVAAFNSQGTSIISGPLKVLNFSYFEKDFPETFRTAYQLRDSISEAGWKKVVAFQTRNPMHRAHEELCRMAFESLDADGILIHMLLGKLKPGDIPADVRDSSIRIMAEKYFPAGTIKIAGYGFDMMYAGPREAVLHAVFRQNSGCSHLIVGRDHAGVGDYYGPFEAQEIFREQVPEESLEIEIFEADHTAWSKKLNKVVMMRDHPDHTKEDWLFLSGTKVREMLSKGEPLPEEFSRPEVTEILMKYYQS